MILLGSDPEIMAFDASNAVLPAWEWLPPEPTPKNPSLVHAYWDGVQAEISCPPARDAIALTRSIRDGLRIAHNALARTYPNGYLATRDVVRLSPDLLTSAPDAAIMLGCAPSANAYNIPPIDIGDPRAHPLRYSGSHYHYSTDGEVPRWWPEGTVVVMDKLLGVVLTSLGRGLEDRRRRVAYGRPGEFRVAGKRLEYRTPGSFLLASPSLFRFAADFGRLAFELSLQHPPSALDLPDVTDAITNCDADWCSVRLREHHALFMPLVKRVATKHNIWWDALLHGAWHTRLTDKKVSEAWNL